MKVQNITNIDKFFEIVDSCKGKVELVTGEGDRLNLKSKLLSMFLWQIFSLTERFRNWKSLHTKKKTSINWLTS